MTRKEMMEQVLARVPEEQKEAFVAEIRGADTKEARAEVLRKYNITFTEEEKAAMKESSNAVSDEELDQAAGGCCNGECDCGS